MEMHYLLRTYLRLEGEKCSITNFQCSIFKWREGEECRISNKEFRMSKWFKWERHYLSRTYLMLMAR